MKKRFLFILCSCLSGGLFAQYTSGTFPVGSIGMTLRVDTTPVFVTLTITGPSNSYLGVGASTSGNGMEAGADGFIYNATSSTDYTFNGVGVFPSADAVQDWTILSNTISGTTRTVVTRRTLAGGPGDIPIPNMAGTFELFCARGNNTLSLGYHGAGNREYVTFGMTFDPSLATGEVAPQEQKAMLYPNPVGDILHLNNSVKIDRLKIYDAAGRVILSPATVPERLDVSALQSGTYYVEIRTSDGTTAYEKIIKK